MDKKFEITSKRFVNYEGNKAVYRVEIFADTADDVPEPQDVWAVGSMCIIGETHEYRWLNSERKWV